MKVGTHCLIRYQAGSKVVWSEGIPVRQPTYVVARAVMEEDGMYIPADFPIVGYTPPKDYEVIEIL